MFSHKEKLKKILYWKTMAYISLKGIDKDKE